MDRDAAITRIKRKLSFRTGTSLDTVIVEALVDAQRKLENSAVILPNGLRTPVPWFLGEVVEIPLVVDQAEYAFPTGFIKEIEDLPPNVEAEDGQELTLIKTIPTAARDVLVAVEGPPQVYYIVGETFVVLPTPDDTYTWNLPAYIRDAPLTTNIENKFLKWVPDLLIGVAGAELAGDLRDKSAKAEFQELIVAGGIMLWDQKITQEMTNRRTAIGVVR